MLTYAIAEIRDKKLHYFRCGYDKFMEEREVLTLLALLVQKYKY
jgi:hypothetical protein